MFQREPKDVYEALVADLSTSIVPTSIMGATLVAMSILACIEIDATTYRPVALAAALASGLKVSVVRYHRLRTVARETSHGQTRRFEIVHAILTVGMASSVGIFGAMLFREPQMDAHLVATALLFAYCSGVVSRLSVRPAIAVAAIVTAALPCLVSAGAVGDMTHGILSLIFLIFLAGAMETIAHVHRNAARHIATRLQMALLARHDPLTGLLNRFGLREAFDAFGAAHRRVSLHAFDLDGFKAVNDQHGHRGGDEVLREIAERLRDALTDGELAARVGGDEFVVIQPGADAQAVAALARRLHDLIVAPYPLTSGASVRIGVSLGFTSATASATLEDALRDADAASYVVKRDGGGVRAYRDEAGAAAPGSRAPPRPPGLAAAASGLAT